MQNRLFKKYFDLAENKSKEKYIFSPIFPPMFKMATKSKNLSKVAITQELCNRFQCSIACLKGISIELKFITLDNFIFCTNMADKIQNIQQCQKIFKKVAITPELCDRFQCPIA